jgi:hypothetical protein
MDKGNSECCEELREVAAHLLDAKSKKKGGGAPPNKRKQTSKQNGAPASQVPRRSSRGVDILDLLAQIKANEIAGGDTELVYSGALLQEMKAGTRKRWKQVEHFGARRKEGQNKIGAASRQTRVA